MGYGDGTKIRLSFQITQSDRLHVVELADGYAITATVVDSDLLDWWLRGFGDGVSKITRSPLTG